jgi:hypothetical protein
MKITLTNDQIVGAFKGYEAASTVKIGGELAFTFASIGASLRSRHKIIAEAEESIAKCYGDAPKDEKGNELPGIAIPPIKQRVWSQEREQMLLTVVEVEIDGLIPKSLMINPKYEWPIASIEALTPFIDSAK